MKSNFAVLLFAILLSIKLTAQTLPSYPERSFGNLSDTSLSFLKSMEASEGFIDPNEYQLGPGDNIFISISGIEERNFNLMINHEGILYIPRVGIVDLKNKNLAEGKSLIEKKLNENFRNVDIYVGLGEVRKIKVSLVGDVVKSSSYILTSNSRLLDLIKSSAGLTKTSDYRNIKIKSKNGETRNVDYLKFLRTGNFIDNPYLKDGDVVLIDKTDRTVYINGQIKYPGTYEYKEGESVKDLIDLAGGLLYKARHDSIEIVSFLTEGFSQNSSYYSYDYIQNHNIKVNHSDQILIREISEYYDEQWVIIRGRVKYPGLYKIKKNTTTLTETMNEAGGFLEDAGLVNATLFRTNSDTTADPEFERIKLIPRVDMSDDEYDYLKAKSRQRNGKVVVDFRALFREKQLSEDVVLKRGDIITVPERKNYITLIGQVVNPGNIVFDQKLSVEDYIALAGGFSWRAVEGDVRIIKVNTGEWVDADDIEKLDPGDTIWVLEDPPGPKFWDVFTTSLSILGQVAAMVAATVAVIVATR